MITSAEVRDVLARALAQSSRADGIWFIGHFRHHWIAVNVRPQNQAQPMVVRIFDSAPSPMVQRDVRRLAVILGWPAPMFVDAPHQARGSQECGLFALAAVLLRRELPSGVFSLAGTRDTLSKLLVTKRMTFLDQFIAEVAAIYEGRQDHHVSEPNGQLRASETTIAETPIASGGDDVGPARCTAHKQAKRGGQRCGEPAVNGHTLCELHLLVAHQTNEKCSSTSKAGKPCVHKRVRGLPVCPFHIGENFPKFLESLRPAEPERLHAPVVEVATDPATPVPKHDDLLEEVLQLADDPDFESEMWMLAEGDLTFELKDIEQAVPATRAPATLQDLLTLLTRPRSRTHPLAMEHIRLAAKGYMRALRSLSDNDTVRYRSWPLATGLLETLNARRRSRDWRWVTMLRHMCELQGALQRLPLTHGASKIKLIDNEEWSAALAFVSSQARAERPRFAKCATYQNVLEAIRREERRPVKLLLGLTWLCCGRTGDVRQLQPEDVHVMSTDKGLMLTITFYRGKTVKKRGPYSLHTLAPQEMTALLGWNSAPAEWVPLLAKASLSCVLSCLRTVDPQLENRSLRRGALQALAASGVDETTILLFSGHATLQMLRRYLGWGSIGKDKERVMTTAAAALGPNAEGGEVVAHKGHRHDPYVPVFDIRKYKAEPSSTHEEVRTVGLGYERWLEFLGCEAPPIEALPPAVSRGEGTTMVADDDLPLHSKSVLASADLSQLSELATSPELREYAAYTFPWLYDEARYERLTAKIHEPSTRRSRRRNAQCRLSDSDVRTQIDLEKYELPKLSSGAIKRFCRVFTVPERNKHRRRHIAEPLINDEFSMTPTIRFATRAERHAMFAKYKGGYAVTLDFASCFDQYGLDPRVRNYFGLRLPDGTFSRMAVLPMGFRPAAAVAQCGTWCVTDIPYIDVNGSRLYRGVDFDIMTYIDNIAILARTADAVAALTRMVADRSAICGLRLNEHHPPMVWPLVEPQQVVEFLGEEFDLKAGTVRQSPKTHAKVCGIDASYLQEDGRPMTRRQVAAVVGLFLFASAGCGVAAIRHQYFEAMKYYRSVAQACWNGGKPDWDGLAAPLSKRAAEDFTAWALALRSNPPLDISADCRSTYPTDILYTDASEERWSCIHIGQQGLRVYAEAWTDNDRREGPLQSSVWSEPLAIRKAICRIISFGASERSLMIYTDHEPIVGAVAAPIAHTYPYWRLQCLLQSLPCAVTVRHVPGVINPADAFTRGPLDDALARRHSPEWEAVLGAAQDHHANFDTTRNAVAVTGTEWSATARNPLRKLG